MKTTAFFTFSLLCVGSIFAQAPQKTVVMAGYDSMAVLQNDGTNFLGEKGCYNRILTWKNGKKGLLDANKNVILPPVYDTIQRFYTYTDESWMLYQSPELQAGVLIDSAGYKGFFKDSKMILPCQYHNIYSICDDLYAEKNKQKGVFTHTGQVLIEMKYDTIWKKSAHCFFTYKDKLWGFVNTQTGFVQEPIFDKIQFGAVLWYKKGKEYGFIKNDTISKSIYQKLETREYVSPCADFRNCSNTPDFEQSCFIAQQNKKKGLVDENDAILLPFKYDSIAYLKAATFGKTHNGTGYFLKKGKYWRFMTLDRTTKAIEFPLVSEYKKIEYISSFPDTRDGKKAFIVQNKRNKYGIISIDNKVLVPIIHDSIQHNSFMRDFPIAVCDNLKKWSVFAYDRTHQTPYEYDAVKLCYTASIVTQNDKKGLLNAKTVLVLPCEYDDIEYIQGAFKLSKDGKTTWAGDNGNIIADFK